MQFSNLTNNSLTLIVLNSVNSTQTYAHEYITSHIVNEPIVITAETQQNGFGTKNQEWLSSPGNLYMTFCKPMKLTLKTQFAIQVAKIVQECVEKLTGISLTLKHPNDLLYKNKKCCGILCTWDSDSEKRDILCIGIGFNCKTAPLTTQPTIAVKCNKEHLMIGIIEKLMNL